MLPLLEANVEYVTTYRSLTEAISAIRERETNLIITNEQSVDEDLMIPANIHLVFMQGGMLSIGSGITVHLTSQPSAGLYQIFKGDGNILLQDSQVDFVYPQWWGAVADYVPGEPSDEATDNLPAFHKAIRCWSRHDHRSYNAQGGTIRVPNGKYWFSDTLHIEKGIRIAGQSVLHRKNTVFFFPPNITGLIVERVNFAEVDGARTGRLFGTGPNQTSGAWSVIEGIHVTCTDITSSTSGHGIELRDRATIRQCTIVRMGGNGIHIDTGRNIPVTLEDGRVASLSLNANTFLLENLIINSCQGHGVYVNGRDANAGVGIHIDASSNGGVGIFDSSFLGNCWIGCHTAANQQGYRTEGGVIYAAFIDCYAEMGQAQSIFTGQTTVQGGNLAGSAKSPQRFGYSNSRIIFRDTEDFINPEDRPPSDQHQIQVTIPDANLQSAMSFRHNLYFYLVSELAEDLNSGVLSEALREAFAEHDIILSPHVSVEILELPSGEIRWKVTDTEHRLVYSIRSLDDSLQVFLAPPVWFLKRWSSPGSYYNKKWVIAHGNKVPIWWTDDGHPLGPGKLGLGQLANSNYYWRLKQDVTLPVSSVPVTFEVPVLHLRGRGIEAVDVQVTFVANDAMSFEECDVQIVGVQIDGARNRLKVRLKNNSPSDVSGKICARISIDEDA